MKTNTVISRLSRQILSYFTSNKPTEIDFHGASIISEQGEEIPITEVMVQKACNLYIRQWEKSQQNTAND